ncbi:hypothetical protein CRYUN_Cryun18bG0000800 [Craigia yunnanensis]
MKGFFIGGVSIILVVGVCIGLIAHKNSSFSDKDVLSTTYKSVAAICAPTDFKQACIDSLGSVANNESAVPKDFIQAAIHVTLQELQAVFNKSGSIFGNAEREAEIKNWLNAVISFQESCVDQVPQPQLQRQLSDGLLSASQLTSNALAIVNSISQILTAFNLTSLNLGDGESNRKLMDDDTYPSWVPSADRKLLGSRKNAQLTPNAVVAKDGSGQYKTIGDAL